VSISKKIISFEKLSFLKKLSNKKVLVGGCFDIFHYGHLQFLHKAKEKGDVLIIALESDQFIKKQKKRKPVHNQIQRAQILAELYCVDYVLLLPEIKGSSGYQQLVKDINPNVIAITKGDLQINNKKTQINSIGGELLIVTAYIDNFSTQQIINLLN